jgi:hypothetical protein
MSTIDPATSALLPHLPLTVDPESPEGRQLRVAIINARLGGLARVSLIEGKAGISVVSLDARRAKRAAMREQPL